MRLSIAVNMVTLQCEVPNCTISKTADDLPTALQLLQLHDKQAHGAAAAVSVAEKQKAPKIDRHLNLQISCLLVSSV